VNYRADLTALHGGKVEGETASLIANILVSEIKAEPSEMALFAAKMTELRCSIGIILAAGGVKDEGKKWAGYLKVIPRKCQDVGEVPLSLRRP
jgi:hypothetical protein